jgi:hypothetical protein
VTEEDAPSRALLVSRVFLILLGYLTIVTALSVITLRGLVADGAYYFIVLLERRWPTTIEPSRIFAHALTQWPLVLALKAGITDIPTLRYFHSVGLYYLAPLHLVLCYWIVPRAQRDALIWPLLSLFAGSMNAWFVAVTESHVMTFLFWPLALFMVYGRFAETSKLLLFLVLSFATLLSYETMAVQGLLLAGISLWRAKGARTSIEQTVWLSTTGVFLAGVIIAIYFALYPRQEANRAGFVSGIFRFMGTSMADLNYPVLLSVAALALVGGCFLWGSVKPRLRRHVLTGFGAAATIVAFAPVLRPESFRPVQQFQARAWIGFLPVVLGTAMLAARRWGPRPIGFRLGLAVLAMLAFAQLSWQALAAGQWHGYTTVFRSELAARRGFVSFDSSGLARPQSGIQVIRDLTWEYTVPLLSIALAPSGKVSTIIGVRGDVWWPFDPMEPCSLPRLERYGVDYSQYLQALPAR